MLWRGGRRSDNVEDQRGAGGFSGGGFGGGRRIGLGGGVGLVVIVVVAMLFGVDPTALLQSLDDGTGSTGGVITQDQSTEGTAVSGSSNGTVTGNSADDDDMKQFVQVVLADTEDTWTGIFQGMNKNYADPRLVLFSGQIRSACGFADAAMGPFYCPGDSKVYIDLAFYDELSQRFHASGDFAQAYVIAHEVGHHVQHLLGITDQVDRVSGSLGRKAANALSVQVELQADCFAGIWAFHADQEQNAQNRSVTIQPGDIEEALNAASAIGDDRLQAETQGNVVPDSFTHGTSAQRVRWFKNGFKNGDVGACDTFDAKPL